MMKSSDFVAKLKDVAQNYKTLYVMGCFGAPLNATNKARYCSNHSYNQKALRTAMIQAATADTFGFDCVCLIKGILWGWNGNTTKTYGGASYTSNGVPDVGADGIITYCKDVSATGWADMVPGELLWMSGHVGIYIGNGQAVECTPAWKNCVQITTVLNIKAGTGHKWTKHGKLPWVDYSAEAAKPTTSTASGTASTGSANDEKTIWAFLAGKGLNHFAIAGIMGNLYAESLLKSDNLQNTYERKLGYNDKAYTAAVDSGAYSNFVRDAAGYGLAQWTYWSRKQALLNYAKKAGKSIGDLQMQLDFMWQELQGYTGVMSTLKKATSVKQASDSFMVKYEGPADQSDAAKNTRAAFGQKYYDKYANQTVTPEEKKSVEDLAKEVLEGKWGNGDDRKEKLTAAGYDYRAVQDKVNDLCKPKDEKVEAPNVTTAKADYAQNFTESKAGPYKVNAKKGLNLRSGASKSKSVIEVMANGTTVNCYGYHTGEWLLVISEKGNQGFCHIDYLTKA